MSKLGLLLHFCLSAILFMGASLSYSQSDKEYFSTFKTNEIELLSGNDSLSTLDSSLDNFHVYHPAFRSNFGHLDLGNSGTAIHPMVFAINETQGFDLGWHYLDQNRFFSTPSSPLYKVRKPITKLHYVQGPNELIGLNALHSQNIKPNWNMGVEFQRLKENGFYLRQATGQYNTRVFNWFHSKDFRYHLIASATWSRIRNQESGGIVSRAAFDTLQGPVRNPLVNYYAHTAINTVRSNHYSATQLYRFGSKLYYPTEASDTAGNPILDTIATFVPSHQISLRTSVQTYTNLFEISGLEGMPFSNFYRDSVATFDSLRMRDAHIELGYQLGAFRTLGGNPNKVIQRLIFFNAFAGINLIHVGWEGDYAAYNNLFIRSETGTRSWLKNRTGLMAQAYFGLSGYNQGDFDIKLQAARHLGPIYLGFEVQSKSKSPDFFHYYYFGNHHFWHNKHLNKQNSQQIQAIARNKGPVEWIRLSGTFSAIENYTYLTAGETIHQLDETILVNQASLRLNKNIRWFHVATEAIWQQTNKSTVLPLSRLIVKQSLFADTWLFKNNLHARAGTDIYWCESFNAPHYVAPLRSWQVQDPNNAFAVGSYPFINAYVTGRIKTVTFSLMFQHITAGLFGSSYYSSPFYPMQPRAFRFGISWNMYE